MTAEKRIRAIVFKESDLWVAQCLEYDIAAQATDLNTLLDRLDMTVAAEMSLRGVEGLKGICSAPVYYHTLWEKPGTLSLGRVDVVVDDDIPDYDIKIAA